LTHDKSPVRESRTPGSVGEVPGNRHLYPTGVRAMLEKARFVVGDAAWEKVAPLLPGKASDPGATARDNRLFLEAVLWRVRTGAPWRDLPSEFGRWNSVFQRFRRWVKGGVFERVFTCLSGEPDFEYALVDGTIVTAHQKASGARGGPAIRPSAARAAA
jgi:transposase